MPRCYWSVIAGRSTHSVRFQTLLSSVLFSFIIFFFLLFFISSSLFLPLSLSLSLSLSPLSTILGLLQLLVSQNDDKSLLNGRLIDDVSAFLFNVAVLTRNLYIYIYIFGRSDKVASWIQPFNSAGPNEYLSEFKRWRARVWARVCVTQWDSFVMKWRKTYAPWRN